MLDTLANLGEFLGGSAVLISLVYVAIQLRQARLELQRQNARQMIVENNRNLHALILDESLSETHLRATKDEQLSDLEALRWHVWMVTWVTYWEQAFLDTKRGQFEGVVLDQFTEGIAEVLRSQNGAAWWRENARILSGEAAEEINRVIANNNQTASERVAKVTPV